MSTRAIITVPPQLRAGEIFEVRALIAHPMETGHRVDHEGQVVPQRILRRFSCRLDGRVVFSADLHPAVAANPLIAFALRAQASGTLSFTWEGDEGFSHSQEAPLNVV